MQTNNNTLALIREQFLPDRTLGTLIYGKQFQIYTLEPVFYPPGDPRHNTKNTAIPEDTYQLHFRNSPRFGPGKLYLSGILYRSGILFHVGNTPADTKGCILTGTEIHSNNLINSRMALARLEQFAAQLLKQQNELHLFITH